MKLLTYPIRFLINRRWFYINIVVPARGKFCFSFKSKLGNENYLQVRQICKTQEEEAQSRPNILDLPEEILVNILEYLDVVDIIK